MTHTHITEPSAGYFQVRLKRGGVEYRRRPFEPRGYRHWRAERLYES